VGEARADAADDRLAVLERQLDDARALAAEQERAQRELEGELVVLRTELQAAHATGGGSGRPDAGDRTLAMRSRETVERALEHPERTLVTALFLLALAAGIALLAGGLTDVLR
jgi:hypothetical protein